MSAKRLEVAYLALLIMAITALLQSCHSQEAKAAELDCDMEAADQAWQHTYGAMNETELMAGVVLEPVEK